MFQSLATLFFLCAALVASGLIAVLIRADWETIRVVLGLAPASIAPLPPRMRTLPARRATMIQLKPRVLRRAA